MPFLTFTYFYVAVVLLFHTRNAIHIETVVIANVIGILLQKYKHSEFIVVLKIADGDIS